MDAGHDIKICLNCGDRLLPQAEECPTCGADVSNYPIFNSKDSDSIYKAVYSAPHPKGSFSFNKNNASKSPKDYLKIFLIFIGAMILLSAMINTINGSNKVKSISTSSSVSSKLISSNVSSSIPKKSFEQNFADDNKLDLKTANNIIKASEAVGISRKDINSFSKLEDWKEGKKYQYGYKNTSVTVFLSKDNEVSGLLSGTVKLYVDGKARMNINDYLITDEQKSALQYASQQAVIQTLVSPSTAKFPGGFLTPFDDWSISKNKSIYQISSYVDSQNTYGAIIRNKFTIKATIADGENPKVIYLKIGDQVIIG